ncbi:PAS domain S-box protein [Pedobacter sp.]|jgi:PAS domain S-box-containing protein|uniref:PAS domain-containing protein n=1 Tax=Pedobacter sp. TaxID=1411316 RepID=UPI002C7B3603|nr:PAS domain S-box protein [Pedobacter sp.]HWW42689.1 PAS domain S-box protein [Pedobacter sp.]
MEDLQNIYKNLFQFNPQPLWTLNTETFKFVDVNEAALHLYGYSREDFLEMTIQDITPKEDLPELEQAIKNLKNTSNSIIVNRSRHLTKQKNLINVELKSSVYESNGVINEFVAVTDITEQIKTEIAFEMAQQELIRREQRYKALVQGGSDLTAIIDLDGIYKFVSESCGPLLGIEPEQLMGKTAFDYIHPEDAERVGQTLSKLIDMKRVMIDPFRFRDGYGQWRWISTAATNLIDDPVISGIVTNSKDITDVINVNNELRLSNERYKLVLKAADEAICDWDIANDHVDWGIGFQEIFGYDLSIYNNNLWSENIHPDDKEAVLREMKETLEDPSIPILYSEYRFFKANKEIAIIQYRGIFLRNEEGKAIRAVGAFRDITAQKHSLSKIQMQNKQLKEIAWTQSHKVRDSLTRIMGLVELLKDEEFLTEAQKQLVNYLCISAEDLDLGVREIVKNAERS